MSRSRLAANEGARQLHVAEQLHPHREVSTRYRLSRSLGLVLSLLWFAAGCSSTHSGADAANGTGGTAGTHEDAGGEAGMGSGGSTGAPFGCGDASCITGQYCRTFSAPGGNIGTNNPNIVTYQDCQPLRDDCPAHDCTCLTFAGGFVGCPSCSVLDGGGVVATCDKI